MAIKFVGIDEFDWEQFASDTPQLSGNEWRAVFIAFLRLTNAIGPQAADVIPPTSEPRLDSKLRNMEMGQRVLIRNTVLNLTKPKF